MLYLGTLWKRDLMEILGNKDMFNRYFELRYEDLVKDTRGSIRQISEFADLK